MSIKAMTWIWDNSEAQGTELLCLLALADYANDEGECYPGIKRLAHRCRVGERAIQKVLRKLEEAGEVETITGKGVHTKTGVTNRYRLIKYAEGVNAGTPLDCKGVNARTPLKDEGVNVGTPLGVNVGTPDPSVVTISKNNNLLPSEVAATQPPAPLPVEEKPKRRKQQTAYANPQTGVSTNDIKDAYVNLLLEYEPGVVISHPQEAAAAQALAQAGWTPGQVTECYRHLKKDAFWKSKHLSLWSIAKQIGAYYARNKRPTAPGGPTLAAQGIYYDSAPVTPDQINF